MHEAWVRDEYNKQAGTSGQMKKIKIMIVIMGNVVKNERLCVDRVAALR